MTYDNPTGDNLNEARRLADVVHGRLVERAATVGVAESLTGGLLSALLTEAPGTSVTFRGGLVVYSTDLKQSLAGVPSDDLDRCGPVHETTAEHLASGARERLAADYGIGLTGVAGPGGQGDSPVGEVFVGVAGPGGVHATKHQFDGNRNDIRAAAVTAALGALVAELESADDEVPA
jgi:nicotinamide-nucleotide amidase